MISHQTRDDISAEPAHPCSPPPPGRARLEVLVPGRSHQQNRSALPLSLVLRYTEPKEAFTISTLDVRCPGVQIEAPALLRHQEQEQGDGQHGAGRAREAGGAACSGLGGGHRSTGGRRRATLLSPLSAPSSADSGSCRTLVGKPLVAPWSGR